MLIWDQPAIVAAWVARAIGMNGFHGGPILACGVTGDDGALLAGVVYHDFYPEHGDIQVSMAAVSPRWCTRANVRAILRAAYAANRCDRITACIDADNIRALKILTGLGFVIEGRRLRARHRTTDELILGLYREQAARWIGD